MFDFGIARVTFVWHVLPEAKSHVCYLVYFYDGYINLVERYTGAILFDLMRGI